MIKGERIIDLLTFLPKKCIEVIFVNNFLDILNHHNTPNTLLTLMIEVHKAYNLPNSTHFVVEGRCYNAQCRLLFFKTDRLLYSLYKIGTTVIVCGKVQVIQDKVTMVHPLYKGRDLGQILPYEIQINYCSDRAKNLFLKRKIEEILKNLNCFNIPPDWINQEKREEYNLPTFIQALSAMHGYGTVDMCLIKNSSRRIILDEIIAYHLLLRSYAHHGKGSDLKEKMQEHIDRIILDIIEELSLPFTLSDGQMTSLKEIFYDVIVKKSLYRLLQGDVGSGKTIVALIIISYIVKIGRQVALLVPSITLASQHYQYFKNFLPNLNISLFSSVSVNTQGKRTEILNNIKSGEIQIIIGTHSLLGEGVEFKDLGLIVFDEHHKFGVLQRSHLADRPDCYILSTTATPSPRTMMFAYYGFLDLSTIENHKSKTRQTFSIDRSKIDKVINKIPQWITEGGKIYWVCPKIQQAAESGENNVMGSCIERYNSLRENQIPAALIHGKLSPEEISRSLEDFRNNITKVLVCTTVIEVGIDIKDATIMIIENAEMFGISQLHQLRGRVGRGNQMGKCLLIYDQSVDEYNYKMDKFISMESGFEVSNLDLELRGPGDIVGTSQKGKKGFSFIGKDTEKILFKIATDIAPTVTNNSFIRELLRIEREEMFLKKN